MALYELWTKITYNLNTNRLGKRQVNSTSYFVLGIIYKCTISLEQNYLQIFFNSVSKHSPHPYSKY